MLLLVPSHKANEEGVGKDAAPSSRILVLLSSDTDISSNVVVPDTAITTTLGTNDTLETIASTFPQSPFFSPAAALLTQPKHSRDHLGILQPSRPDDPFDGFQQPSQQSNVYRSQDRMDDSRSRKQLIQPGQRTLHPYGDNDVNYNRARRHSHTGLVEFDHSVGPSMSGPRLRARQSMSLAAPYQHQPFRTPRLLRGAFRKARKEQSPLLTSASFGTDYAMQNPTEVWEGDDIFLPWKSVSSIAEHPSTNRISTSPKSLLHGDGSLSQLTNPQGEQLEGEIINNKTYADFDSIDSSDDIELDGDDKNINNGMTEITTKSSSNPPVPPRRGHRDSSEIVDVDGLSDEEMVVDESFKTPITAHESPTNSRARIDQWLKGGTDKKTLEDRTVLEIDLENSLDADMNTILGMASDMDLVMPKFDDNYLQDLNTEPALTAFTREHSSVSNSVSPFCSHSPSTTITCISSRSSPSPSVTTGLPGPTAPAHVGSSPLQSNTPGQRTTGRHFVGQDLSSFHRDIDILRRHREELKESPELSIVSSNPRPASLSNSSSSSSNPSTVSSSASPPSLTTEKQDKLASQGPIYFKPSHHSLPDQSGPGEQHLHQNVMIIQSNQWAMDTNKGSAGTRAFSPQPIGIRGDEGNHIYMVRESSPTSPPPPLLDKSAIMTTHNISLATANMNVLTPQEVQEVYYTRRNMRLNQQRQRRRSSAAVAATGAAAAAATSAATMMTSGVSTESRSLRCEGVSPLTSTSSSSSSSSRSASVHGSDLIHPFDISNNNNSNKSIVAAPAIGATILPPSYYIPPSAFRTEAAVAAEREREREMERKRKEEEEAFKESFLVFPSPTPS
ncbi:hypothetical protein BGZ47_011312 [Haplosporangium gracile]|nr:hypothetical protein BGZ47_011312 [Haplosporangium gracile]